MIPVTVIISKDGGDLVFTPHDLKELSYVRSVSLDGNEMQSDETYALVRQKNPDWLRQWSGVMRNAPVWFAPRDAQSGAEKLFYKGLERKSKNYFLITAQSPLGRLTSQFRGDLYDGQYLSDVIADVIGGAVLYSVNEKLNAVRVYGWAPYQSRRETLHMLALAYGFLIRRDSSQNLFFTVPETDSYEIPQNAFFAGGSVDYRLGSAYARVDVTAYDFLQTDDARPATLFDNSAGGAPASRTLVKFDKPMFDLSVSGNLRIHESGVNYAVISGVGALSGKPYAQISGIVSADGDPAADPEQVLSISGIPLITPLNADSVAKKFLAVHNAPAVVCADIRRSGQRAGDRVSFTDPYGDSRTGYITEISGNFTSFDRASVRILCGYEPAWDDAYNDVVVLADSGAWTVPDALDGQTLRVILIGGGQGGASGEHGTDAAASGGVGGEPGAGGRIYEAKVAVVAGQSFSYQSGAGGAGGVASPDASATVYADETEYHLNARCGGGQYDETTLDDAIALGLSPCPDCVDEAALRQAARYVSNPGAAGGASLFGDYSSDDGASSDVGFRDILSRTLYALPGMDYGVNGGAATSGSENGDRNAPAYVDVRRPVVSLPWDAAQTWQSGAAGECHRKASDDLIEWSYGGFGGGAAVGADGGDGQRSSDGYPMWGGNGGQGADASVLFPTDTRAYGCGGSGGHGGGEGGMGGSGNSSDPSRSSVIVKDGNQGAGGAGSDGQAGRPGCILIYFHS